MGIKKWELEAENASLEVENEDLRKKLKLALDTIEHYINWFDSHDAGKRLKQTITRIKTNDKSL